MTSSFSEATDDTRSATGSLSLFYRQIGTCEKPILVDGLDESVVQTDLP